MKVSNIIDGILQALREEFGEGYTLYTESVEQGLKEPCFFVMCINPQINLFRGVRYFVENQFAISYFPSTKFPKAEINDVTERLYSCLEYITANGDLLMSRNLSNAIEDNVLHFFVNYNYFSYTPKEETPMEEYTLDTEVRGE